MGSVRIYLDFPGRFLVGGETFALPMTKTAFLLFGAAILLSPAAHLQAYEDDPGATEYHHLRGLPEETAETTAERLAHRVLERVPRGAPVAFYPTLRYYTKEGTIAYKFVPVDRTSMHRISNVDPLLLSPVEMSLAGANTRVIIHNNRPSFRATAKMPALAPASANPISPASTAPVVHPAPVETVTPSDAPVPFAPTEQVK